MRACVQARVCARAWVRASPARRELRPWTGRRRDCANEAPASASMHAADLGGISDGGRARAT
eukprot:728394-Pleurochrysis_carterae.AAC.1